MAVPFGVQVLVVLLLAGALTALLRRPRLRVEASLRGGTRGGTLYVTVTNRGGWTARGLRVEVRWRSSDGTLSREAFHALEPLASRDAVRVEFEALQRLLPEGASAWDALVVRVRASNALPASTSLALTPRPRSERPEEPSAPEPVRYARARELPCPERADGRHDFEERRLLNDGVVERWRFCRACRHVEREPLSAEEEAVQRRTREARAARQRRILEDELSRMDEEARAYERARRRRQEEQREQHERHRAPPASEADEYPVEVAYFVLELDPSKATWQDVLAAHRRLALAHHPDRHAGATPETRAAAEQKMQEINRARDRLREVLSG